MDIMTYIGVGRENAVTRHELGVLTHLPDRMVRRLIEQARLEGNIIINDGSGVGYYVSEDLKDLMAQYRQNESRARSILAQQKHLKKKIKQAEGHRAFSVLAGFMKKEN